MTVPRLVPRECINQLTSSSLDKVLSILNVQKIVMVMTKKMKHSNSRKQCKSCAANKKPTSSIQENFKDAKSPIILLIFAVIVSFVLLKRRRKRLPVVTSNENFPGKAFPQKQRIIKDLERDLKEKNISERNLQHDIEKLSNEMIVLRKNHYAETEELRAAYNELKEEASQVVAWLQKRLVDNHPHQQSRDDRVEEIARAGEDSDLDSLTCSEREQLSMEIEEERKHWIGDLRVRGSPSRLDFIVSVRSEEHEL